MIDSIHMQLLHVVGRAASLHRRHPACASICSRALLWLLLASCCAAAIPPSSVASSAAVGAAGQPGPLESEAELLAILSRAATVSGFLIPKGEGPGPAANTTDTIRMLAHAGVRYAGRSVFVWGGEGDIPAMLPHVNATAAAVHAAVPDIILEGAVFEIVTVRVSSSAIYSPG